MILSLDKKDKQLLYEIDFDARKSYAELARKLRMSKRGVEYKWKNLEKKGVILGYAPVINTSKLGYIYGRTFVKFRNVTKEIYEKIEEYIRNDTHIGWSLRYHGLFGNGFVTWAKNITEYKEIVNKFYFKFSHYIGRRFESIGIEVIFYKNRWLTNEHDTTALSLKELDTEISIDTIDKHILKLICQDARMKITEMAEQIGESSKRIAYRIKRLKKAGVLLGVRPTLNHQLLGFSYYKVLFHLTNLTQTEIKKLQEYVAHDQRTVYVVHALGPFDFDVEIMIRSNDDLLDYIQNIQNEFPDIIQDYEATLLSKTVKVSFLPPDIAGH